MQLGHGLDQPGMGVHVRDRDHLRNPHDGSNPQGHLDQVTAELDPGIDVPLPRRMRPPRGIVAPQIDV